MVNFPISGLQISLSSVSGCSQKEKNDRILLISTMSKFMCHAAHLSEACVHGIDKNCEFITDHCKGIKGRDYVECKCNAAPKQIKW